MSEDLKGKIQTIENITVDDIPLEKTTIRVLNDTDKPLICRLLPPNTGLDLKPHIIQPQKMAVVFIKSKKVFLKIWENNVILICEDKYEPK